MQQIIFDLNDIVRFQDSSGGRIIDVIVDEDSNTRYAVLFENGVCCLFLAKDLTLVK